MALRHSVLIVTHPGGVEFHLDHRVDPRHGHHRVVDEAGLVAWIADAGDAHPLFRIAADARVSAGAMVGTQPVAATPREPIDPRPWRAPAPATSSMTGGPMGLGGRVRCPDLDRVTLSGRLVADPELKYLPSGTAVTNLRLASNRSFTSNGERRDEALFVDVEVYGKPGEALAQHKAKGDFLLVDGRLRQHLGARPAPRDSPSWPTRSASARTRRAPVARPRGGRGEGRPAVLSAACRSRPGPAGRMRS